MLRALADRHRVCLLIVGPAALPEHAASELRRHCAEIATVPATLRPGRRGPLHRLADRVARTIAARREVADLPADWAAVAGAQFPFPFRTRRFARVHLFRLYLTPLLERLAEGASWDHAQLDLDEIESLSRERLASLHADLGDTAAATTLAREAGEYTALERRHLPRFARVFVCSALDRDRLAASGAYASAAVAPNVVELPALADQAPPPATPGTRAALRLLFVGTLGYAPNADAVVQLATRILPAIRAGGLEVRCDVVGAGLPPALARRVAGVSGVRLLGYVPDLPTAYRDADAVVVPLRAGGGTRIKILEAFAHALPVVATPIAIEGIEAEDGRELLIADGPEAFAAACSRLAVDARLGHELGRRARALVAERYSDAALRAALS